MPHEDMKLIMTLLARDEADIIRQNIEFHLKYGVDFFVATDNGSTDGTREILREYEKRGLLHLIDEPEQNHDQGRWVNRMAEIAYREHGADIIIHSDADEFWFPRSGNLKTEILDSEATVLKAEIAHVLLEDKEGAEAFPDDTRYVVVKPKKTENYKKATEKENIYLFQNPPKVIFKTNMGLPKVIEGNHSVEEQGGFSVSNAKDIVIFHYPMRGKDHFFKKVFKSGSAITANRNLDDGIAFHWRRWYENYSNGNLESEYKALIFPKEKLDKLVKIGIVQKHDFYSDEIKKENLRTIIENDPRLQKENPLFRAIAFYLPQFHPIPENDSWWGEGFTEWTNVRKTRALFPGHRQPRIPTSELGYYDLRDPEVREKQAELAREHGIEGFCYWHYWFEGKRLLEKPYDAVLESGKPDFPFCLGWANESWSRTWMGDDEQILIKQTYSREDDVEHAEWLSGAFADPRYIKVDGRPLFLVYRPQKLPNPRETVNIIREICKKNGIENPYLIASDAHCPGLDLRTLGFDNTLIHTQLGVLDDVFGDRDLNRVRERNRKLGVSDELMKVYDYDQVWQRMHKVFGTIDHPYIPSVLVSWDNSPRRGKEGIIMVNSNPENFRNALMDVSGRVMSKPYEERLVFINAWNEWAEGMYLEPDELFGKEYLRMCKDAIIGKIGNTAIEIQNQPILKIFKTRLIRRINRFLPKNLSYLAARFSWHLRNEGIFDSGKRACNYILFGKGTLYRKDIFASSERKGLAAIVASRKRSNPLRKKVSELTSFVKWYLHPLIRKTNPRDIEALISDIEDEFQRNSETAVILHLYYLDLWPEIRAYLGNLGTFDLYVSLNPEVGTDLLERIRKEFPEARMFVFENKGRDIYPFLEIFRRIKDLNYKYVLKIHGKKSVQIHGGDAWRERLFDSLLGSRETVDEAKELLDENRTGMVLSAGLVANYSEFGGSNERYIDRILNELHIRRKEDFQFPAGSMFWFKPKALEKMTEIGIGADDFSEKNAEVDGTLAHAVERCFCLISEEAGYESRYIG